MRTLRATDDPFDLSGSYGSRPPFAQGVLVDHEHLFTGRTSTNDAGERVLIGPHGPVSVLCGEIVEVTTEDGRSDGRCGGPVMGNDHACAAHRREEIEGDDGWEHLRRAWGPEGIEWEQRMEQEGW